MWRLSRLTWVFPFQEHSLNQIRLTRFFFFQAEDGIRDVAVTGVQTCALPISQCGAAPAGQTAETGRRAAAAGRRAARRRLRPPREALLRRSRLEGAGWLSQIGRASGRERG